MPFDTDSVRLGPLLPQYRDLSPGLSVNKLVEVKIPRFPYNFVHVPRVYRGEPAKYIAKKKNSSVN